MRDLIEAVYHAILDLNWHEQLILMMKIVRSPVYTYGILSLVKHMGWYKYEVKKWI